MAFILEGFNISQTSELVCPVGLTPDIERTTGIAQASSQAWSYRDNTAASSTPLPTTGQVFVALSTLVCQGTFSHVTRGNGLKQTLLQLVRFKIHIILLNVYVYELFIIPPRRFEGFITVWGQRRCLKGCRKLWCLWRDRVWHYLFCIWQTNSNRVLC